MQPDTALQLATSQLTRVRAEIGKIIVGQQDVVDGVLICLLAGGHVLLEGVPGLGKTTLLRTLSKVMHLKYSRIQFTPDLMPADIVGSMIIDSDSGSKALRFSPGPIFAHLVLADEINRATPKTQSALLEAMQEHTVTSGTQTMELEPPFLVMATQNPIEMEGTYPLPEAQLDRFLMKILVRFPSRAELGTIVERTSQKDEIEVSPVLTREEILGLRAACHQVLVAPHVQDHAISLVMATQPGAAGSARAVQQVHPLRKLAARRAGAGGMRTRFRADEGPPASFDRGHRHHRAGGFAPPHHFEFRRPRGRADSGNHPEQDHPERGRRGFLTCLNRCLTPAFSNAWNG